MTRPLRVLIAEDDLDDVHLLVVNLRKAGFAPTYQVVDDPSKFTAALDTQAWDIVVSDHTMPNFNATTALRILQNRELDLPVLIVSGTIEPQAAVEAMKVGAKDFIMKNDLTRLIPAIERELADAEERRGAKERLLQSQKVEIVGRHAASVIHDFNNLIAVVLGNCALVLQKMPNEDPCRVDVQEIQNTMRHASLLTQQLLKFIQNRRIERKLVDINGVLERIEGVLRRLAGDKVHVNLQLPRILGQVYTDAAQIDQIVMNLCVNAKDAMPDGGTILIETTDMHADERFARQHPPLTPGRYVVISVTDTGIGMSEEVFSRIFEPSFTTKPSGKGTGLGLWNVRQIVLENGGHILVHSEVGRGTSFKILLPRVG